MIGTVAAHTLWVSSTSVLPTTASSLIMYLYIPLSAILGYFVLGETLNVVQSAGALLIIAGSMLGMMGDKWIKT
jgi:drug/metabolite transporter (DMT)-like permease